MRLLLPALLLVLACAPAIPDVKLQGPRSTVSGLPVMKPCALYGEVKNRKQYEATASFSFEPWHTGIGAVAFQRPDGWVLVDPPFGHTVSDDLKASPPWFGAIMGTGEGKEPTLGSLARMGINYRDVKYVLVTHAHWDHVGALRDLTVSQILLSKTELDWTATLQKYLDHGVMKHHFAIHGDRYQPFTFDGPPYETFESSHDVFGDGTVIAVPLPGHTPGSTGYFLNSGDGKRWFLIGDATWSYQGVTKPVHKMPLASAIVDFDKEQLSKTIGKLHAISIERPDLFIIPAHDRDRMDALGACQPQTK